MDLIILKRLVKKELLHSIWLEIDKLVSKRPDSNRTQYGQKISGNHSWYSGASNQGEDIQLSSLVRIFGQLSQENNQEEKIPFENIFSEKTLRKGKLLSYLISSKEEDSYLPEIIKQYEEIFQDIRRNLTPLYREGRLGDHALNQGYEELTTLLQEMESGQDG